MSLGVEVNAKVLANARRENFSRVSAARAAGHRRGIDDIA